MANLTEKQVEQYAELIAEHIRSLEGDYKQPWVSASKPQPQNLDGRAYSAGGMNASMLALHTMSRGYETPVYVTFNRAKTEGIRINSGEVGAWISYPAQNIKDKETGKSISKEDYDLLTTEEKEKYDVYFYTRTAKVFNLDQTNIRESRPDLWNTVQKRMEEQTTKLAGDRSFEHAPIEHMLKEDKWIIPIKHSTIPEAYYSPSEQIIHLPRKEQFISNQEYYQTAMHEMAHSTSVPLNRPVSSYSQNKMKYAREELVAELSASIGASNYGFEKGLKDNNVQYIKGWLSAIEQDPSYLKEVVQDVHKASSFIIKEVDDAYKEYLKKAEQQGKEVSSNGEKNDTGRELSEQEKEKLEREKQHLAAMYVSTALMTSAYLIRSEIKNPMIEKLIEGKEANEPLGKFIDSPGSKSYVDAIRDQIRSEHPSFPELPTDKQREDALSNFMNQPSIHLIDGKDVNLKQPLLVQVSIPNTEESKQILESKSVDFSSSTDSLTYSALIRYREGLKIDGTGENKKALDDLGVSSLPIKDKLFIPIGGSPDAGKLLTSGIKAEAAFGVAELPVLRKENLEERIGNAGISNEQDRAQLLRGDSILLSDDMGRKELVYVDQTTHQVRSISTSQIPIPSQVRSFSLQLDDTQKLQKEGILEIYDKQEHVYHRLSLDVRESDNVKVEYKELASEKYQPVPSVESSDKEKIDYIALRGAKAIDDIWGREALKKERDSFLDRYDVQETYREYLDLKQQGEPGTTIRQNEEIKEIFKQEQRKEQQRGLSV